MESRRWTCTLKIFFSVHEIQAWLRVDSLKCIKASISSYLSDDECWIIDAIVLTIETYENRTVTPISVRDNTVQSMVTNNNSLQQIVIDLVPIKPNSRIALFPYSNIQGNVTIIFYYTNDKNWTSDLYCWLLHLSILLLFWWININSSFIFMWWTDYNMTFSISAVVSYHPSSHIKPRLSPWTDMGVSGWYQGRYGKDHVIIYDIYQATIVIWT